MVELWAQWGFFAEEKQRCGASESVNGGRRRPYIRNWRSGAPLDGVILAVDVVHVAKG
jgi:hypothetical protein